jgi:microcystin-dependent protein
MDEYLGIIKLFGGNFIPKGYLECNGQLLPIQNYQALYSLLGTNYGGDGRSNFALPNLQSPKPESSMKYMMCVEGVYPERP